MSSWNNDVGLKLMFPDSGRMLQFHAARKSKQQFKLDETISSSGLVMLFYGDSGGACRLKFLSWSPCRQVTVCLISLRQYHSIIACWCAAILGQALPSHPLISIDSLENDSLPLYLPGTGKTMTANAIASRPRRSYLVKAGWRTWASHQS